MANEGSAISPEKLAYNTVAMLSRTPPILSLIGLLLSVGLWGVSYWGVGFQSFLYSREELLKNNYAHITELDVILCRGALKWRVSSFDVVLMSPESEESLAADYPGWKHYTGRQIRSGQNPLRASNKLPLWVPALVFAVAPAWSLSPPYRRRRRRKLGLCVKCGYDLRASKDRCPECGTEFETR